MCSPSATGSRQASATIWARWRGGNGGGPTRPPVPPIVEQTGQAVLTVAPAGPPDRGLVALHLVGDGPGPCARREGQDEPRALDLEEGQDLAMSDLAEDRFISGPDGEWVWFSTTHGRRTRRAERDCRQRTSKPNSLRFL
jgi:hypothetical protein